MNQSQRQFQKKHFLERKRVTRLLDESRETGYTAIVANSGYGKTKALLYYLSGVDVKVVWMSMTASDNDPSHFWENLMSSVAAVNDRFAKRMERIEFPDDSRISYRDIKRAVGEIYSSKSYSIVFDDFHMLHNERIIAFIRVLVAANIEGMRIFFVSRNAVNLGERLPVDRYKEINEQDLSFTQDEMAAYFKQLGISISAEYVRDIHTQTKGWACGVYLTGIALQSSNETPKPCQNFSESLIDEMIAAEFFSKYSEKEQHFLIRLALLESYPVRLLEEVFQEELKCCSALLINAIFVRYNQHTRCFQFHPLLRDFLRKRNGNVQQEEVRNTYRLAGGWFQRQSCGEDALECYRIAEDYESMWNQILYIFPTFVKPDLAMQLLEHMKNFPDQFVSQNPMIQAAKGTLQMVAGKAEVEPVFSQRLIREWEERGVGEESYEAIGSAYMNLAFYYMVRGKADFGSCFKKACEYIPGESALYAGSSLYLMNEEPVVLSSGEYWEMDKWVEMLECSEVYYMRLLGGLAMLAKAETHYYRGDMKKAEQFVFCSMIQAKQNNQTDMVCRGYFTLLRIAIYSGDYPLVLLVRKEMKNYAAQHHMPIQLHLPELISGWFFVSMGLNQYIPEWIINVHADDLSACSHTMGMERIIKAWSMLNEKEYGAAIPYLEESKKQYLRQHKYIYLAQAHMLQAIAHFNRGEIHPAVHELWISYEMTWKNDIRMLFPAFGGLVCRLGKGCRTLKKELEDLERTYRHELEAISDSWLDMIIRRASIIDKRLAMIREQYLAESRNGLTEKALSEQECYVLRLISHGHTREEIAAALFVSSSSIKKQLKEIYTKLGAVNGIHAVRIALVKGLI